MKSFVRIVALFCAAFLFVCSLSSCMKAGKSQNKLSDETINADVSASDASRVTRFLVMGVDQSEKLADSIFVVTLHEGEKKARILQLPRDTYANYTDRDYKKLNGALSRLGERGVKEFLSDALGVKLDYFVMLDLSCLRSIIDAIGGVDVTVEREMHYSDPAQGLEIDLGVGSHHLDGEKAEQFVRYRSGYLNADLGRLDAQKVFMKAFAKRCCTLTAPEILRVTMLALTKLRTDIPIHEAIRTVALLRECDTDDIPMATLAGQAVTGRSGASYYAVNRAGGERMAVEYLLSDPNTESMKFDPRSIFDRTDHEKFHQIYIAREEDLPVD